MAEDAKCSDNQLALLQQRIRHVLQTLQEQSGTAIDLEDYRAAFEAVADLQVQPQDVAIEALAIHGLPAEWLIPAVPIPEQVILYFHGGTYINGSLKTDRVFASMLARTTRTKVLQVAYRLAPEYPFPTAVHDGLAAYQWLLAQGYASNQIALAGSAAGGGITLAVLLLARDQGYPLPVVAACLSPWLDLTLDGLHAKQHCTTDIVLNTEVLAYAARCYIHPEQAAQPLVSPLYADVSGLPPLFLQVGQHEILHDDAHQFVRRAKALHMRAQCETWGNMFHGWQAFADVLPEGQLALEQIAAYFEKYFALANGTWSDDTETWQYKPYPDQTNGRRGWSERNFPAKNLVL